jgi:type II secretory pathway pseudopilin PulG
VKLADNAESGFTLIETLVAFVILSGVVIVALSTMSESLRRMQQAAHVVDASKVTQQVLDNLLGDSVTNQSIQSGQSGKFKWQIEIMPLRAPEAAQTYAALIKVSVTESGGKPIPQSHLETIRMLRRQ